MNRLIVGIGLLLVLGYSVVRAAPADVKASVDVGPNQAQAAQLVDVFHKQLLGAMQSSAGFSERYDLLRPAVENFLDVSAIARICLGRAGRELTDAEQVRFQQALVDVISATYASRFDGFSGQYFETTETAKARGGVVVRTLLQRPKGEAVKLDYFFRDNKAFNVVANGVSDLSLRRADYNAILKDQGFAALLKHLQRQRVELSQ